MRDLSPLPPTPASLEALSEDAWRALRDLAAVAGEGARMFEEIAQNFRSVVDYVKAAEEKRSASLEAQAEMVTALFAAIRETDSRFRSLSVAEVIGKFQLALATPAGPRRFPGRDGLRQKTAGAGGWPPPVGPVLRPAVPGYEASLKPARESVEA